jgi:D-glycero-D-manno-heptose 1,7-bisphosphate phosphatase
MLCDTHRSFIILLPSNDRRAQRGLCPFVWHVFFFCVQIPQLLRAHAVGQAMNVIWHTQLYPREPHPRRIDRAERHEPAPLHNSKICRPQLYCPSWSRLNKPPAESLKRRAVFLDRDGTLVEDIGYLTDPSHLKFPPGAVEGIRLLQDQFLIVIITNQSAVARGLLDKEDLLWIHQSLSETLHSYDVFLDAIYACPHHPKDHCYCRKPNPGMLFQARDDFDIQLRLSFMIGDKGSDILAGQGAGVAVTVLIPSYQTEPSLTPDVIPTYRAGSLYEAAKLVLDHLTRSS